MNTKKLPLINTLLLVAIFSYLAIGSFSRPDQDNEAYVITGELFNEFDYQKELNAEFAGIKEAKTGELERFRQEVVNLETKARGENATQTEMIAFEEGFYQLQKKEAEVQQELATLNDQYAVQIWDKLNAFVTEFGEANDYEVIFGADGNGNIMYAESQKNITAELVLFCNSKYNGK